MSRYGGSPLPAVHHPHRDDGVEIFGLPVFLGGGFGGGKDRAHRLVAADFAARLRQVFQDRQADAICRMARSISSVSAAPQTRGAPHLGVQRDGARLVQIGLGMDIDMAEAFQMRQHRHARLRCITRDVRPLPPRGMMRSMRAVQAFQHHARRRRGRCCAHTGSRLRGKPAALQPFDHRGMDGAARSGSNPSRRAGWRHCRT